MFGRPGLVVGCGLNFSMRGAPVVAVPRVSQQAVESGFTILYWHAGLRIRQDILKEKRVDYGAQLSPHWGDNSREFGRGFGEKTLRRMIQFPEVLRSVGLSHH